MAGRPTKRTAANADEIVKTIEVGGTKKMGAAYVGMSESNLQRWQDVDADFAHRLREAEAKRDRALVVTIRQAAPGDWKAAAWLLERVRKEEYGTNKIEVTGKDGGPIKHDHVVTREDAERIAAETGLDVAEVMAEAEAILRGAHR